MSLPSYFLPRPDAGLDRATQAAFESLYATQIECGKGGVVSYTLTAPRWQFLCWLADTKPLLLHGSGDGQIAEFEPRKSDDIDEFGNRCAVYAASDGIWPIYYAILDRQRRSMSLINGCFRVDDANGGLSEPFYYFSISADALRHQPWRNGWIYLLSRETFEQQHPLRAGDMDFHVAQWASLAPVRPLARMTVAPVDFPFLEQIRGHDDTLVWKHAAADPAGFPWLDETEQ